ncbi:hypothetical protein IWW46_004234, partial [Coemansia sp. RSA 2440]
PNAQLAIHAYSAAAPKPAGIGRGDRKSGAPERLCSRYLQRAVWSGQRLRAWHAFWPPLGMGRGPWPERGESAGADRGSVRVAAGG